MFDGSHRSNGRQVSAYEMKDFLQSLEDAHFISLYSVGYWFSWYNKAGGVTDHL